MGFCRGLEKSWVVGSSFVFESTCNMQTFILGKHFSVLAILYIISSALDPLDLLTFVGKYLHCLQSFYLVFCTQVTKDL